LLGIQESISRMEERERFSDNFGWEFGAWFRLRIPFMANASLGRNASGGPKRGYARRSGTY
jgi:hypothetical protein